MLQPFPEEEEELEQPPNTLSDRSGPRTQPVPRTAPPTASQSIAHIGRPIAQVSRIPDPVSIGRLLRFNNNVLANF